MNDANRRTLRTTLQSFLALCAAMPLIIDAAGFSRAVPTVAMLLGATAAITRVMAVPGVDAALPAWLRKDVPLER